MAEEDESSTTSNETLQPSFEKQAPARRRESSGWRRTAAWAKRAALALVVTAGIFALVSLWLPKPIVVDAGVATHDTLQVFVEEDGRTRVRDRYVVAAPLSGTLRRIDLKVGDAVAKGDLVARLSSPEPMLLDARSRAELEAKLAGARARTRQANAALGRAEAARELAVVEARRARELAPSFMSASDRDRYVTEERVAGEEVVAAIQQRNSAAADVESIRAVLDTTTSEDSREVDVLAPADGFVLRIWHESESPLAIGTPLVEIGDTSALEVVVDVLSSDAIAIQVGSEIWVDRWGGATALRGRVLRVEPSAQTHISALGVEEQRANVIAEVDDPPASLGDGYRIEARILTWQGRVVFVPASAVFRHGKGWAVYAVVGGTARLREIGVGHRSRYEVEITHGLDAGTLVVLYPGDKLQDGASIRVR